MKKWSFVAALLFSITILLPNNSFAAGKILETPSDHFLFNGEEIKFSTAPISVDGEKLVPYKELLSSLGIKSDNQHLQWNEKKKSLTFIFAPVKIGLKVGSLSAMLNEKPVNMKAAPVMYKKILYVPVRFIAENLNYKYIADNKSGNYYIRDAASFAAVRTLLEEAIAAMGTLEREKTTQKAKLSVLANGEKFDFETDIRTQTDFIGKTEVAEINHLQKILGKETLTKMQICIANSNFYKKTISETTWTVEPMTEEAGLKEFSFSQLQANDIYCAGFVSRNMPDKNEILLTGNVSIQTILEDYLSSEGISRYTLNQAESEITLNASTHYVTKISLKAAIKTADIPAAGSCTVELTNTYSNFNGDFAVVLPEGIPVLDQQNTEVPELQ